MHGATWYVLNVAPQRERDVMRDIQALGLLAMVPMQKRYRRAMGKGNRPIMLAYAHPIISSYVFIGHVGAMPWRDVASIDHARGCVSFSEDGMPARLTDRDIDIIRQLGKSKDQTGSQALQIGATGRITDGPFQNLEGIVRAIGREHVTISVHMFGSDRDIPVLVDQVERAD